MSTVKHADTRSMFQLILNNFIMVSRRLSTSTDVSSRFILKLSVKFVHKFSQKLHKMQNLFLAHTSNLDCTWCLLNLLYIRKC